MSDSSTVMGPTPCTLDQAGHCTIRGGGGGPHSGHGLFWVPANMTGRRPWGWRDAEVVAVRGLVIVIAYVGSGHEVALWHHVPPGRVLNRGTRVRLHEEMGVFDTPVGWLAIRRLRGGLGPVPAPEGTDPQLQPPQVVVTDLGSGVAYESESSISGSLPDDDDLDPSYADLVATYARPAEPTHEQPEPEQPTPDELPDPSETPSESLDDESERDRDDQDPGQEPLW